MDHIDLRSWLMLHKQQEDRQQLFKNLDNTMKYIHSRGYYITKIGMDYISLEEDAVPFFNSIARMNKDTQELSRRQNIVTMAYFALSIYADCPHLNLEFAKEHLEEFLSYVPSEDASYYRDVISNHQFVYLNDYKKGSKNRSTNEQGNNTGKGKQQTYVKSTTAGKMYADSNSLNSGAYVSVFVLSAILFAVLFVSLLTTVFFLA